MSTNYYDRLFMADGEWRKQKDVVDRLYARYKESQYLYRRGVVKDVYEQMRITHRIHEALTDAEDELSLIEDRIVSDILGKHTVKVYVIEEYTDPMNDDYLIEQITKNGYLTGIKF